MNKIENFINNSFPMRSLLPISKIIIPSSLVIWVRKIILVLLVILSISPHLILRLILVWLHTIFYIKWLSNHKIAIIFRTILHCFGFNINRTSIFLFSLKYFLGHLVNRLSNRVVLIFQVFK